MKLYHKKLIGCKKIIQKIRSLIKIMKKMIKNSKKIFFKVAKHLMHKNT